MVTFVIVGFVGLFALAAVVAVTDALFAPSHRRLAADRRRRWELHRGPGIAPRRWPAAAGRARLSGLG